MKIHHLLCATLAGFCSVAASSAIAADPSNTETLHAYWVCSILLPDNIYPPSAVLHIAPVFAADTTEAAYEAQADQYGAELLAFAQKAGLQLISTDPHLASNPAVPFCEGMTGLSDAYDKYRVLTTFSGPSMEVKVNAVDWMPSGTEAAPPAP